VTERDVSEFIEGVALPESIQQRATSFLKDEQKRLGKYLSGRLRQIDDFATFYKDATMAGQPVYSELADVEVQVILPDSPANRVVSEVMKKVMVSIEPVAIHDWSLTVEIADLYFRPMYVFQFEKLDEEGNVQETKLQQFDPIKNEWGTISAREVRRSSVPWDKIMLLTVDASAVVLQELGGPWLKVTSGLLKVGAKHIPDIVEESRRSRDEEGE
jgi:hypothetical protein